MKDKYFCPYMNQICSGDCDWAYENRHGSEGYCCMRPSTNIEKRINELETGLFKVKEALKEIEWAIKRFKNTDARSI